MNNHPVELPLGTRRRRSCKAQLPLTPEQFHFLQDLAERRETTIAELLRTAARHCGLLGDPDEAEQVDESP